MFSPDRIAKGLYWDRIWRLVDGCTPCSHGCEHCWSARYTHRFDIAQNEHTFTNGEKFNYRIMLRPDNLDLPLRTKKPTSWLILNDLFHEDVPFSYVSTAIEYMADCPRHKFLVLTKRAERVNHYWTMPAHIGRAVPDNIWPGITVCNQQEADDKITLLLQIPAKVRWVSIEPMLGPVNIPIYLKPGQKFFDALSSVCSRVLKEEIPKVPYGKIDGVQWVVLGGETGPGARPMYFHWARSVVRQCKDAGVPVFVKQIHINSKVSKNMDEWPDDLRRREFPCQNKP